jgi:cytochrome b561
MPGSYAPTIRWLHWLVAALVLLQIGLGLWVTQAAPADDALKMGLYATHDGVGLVIFTAMLARLAARLRHGALAPGPGTPEWSTRLARANHVAFYILLLVQPVLGWFNNGANGFPLSVFGLFDIPAPIGRSEALAGVFSAAHFTVAALLGLLIVLHLLGVFYHVAIRRDGVLRRMA